MKRSTIYGLAALTLAFVGVSMFGFGIFPVVNPIQFEMTVGWGNRPASIFSFLASIVVLWIALRWSGEAQRLTQEEQSKASGDAKQ